MKTIDIVTVDITLVGGIERVTSILANNLSKRYKVRIISIYKSNDTVFYDIDNFVEIIYLTKITLLMFLIMAGLMTVSLILPPHYVVFQLE